MGTRGMWVRLVVAVPLLAVELAFGAPKGASAAAICGDTPSGVEEITGTVKDSLVVPVNSLCRLIGATIRGGVTVGAGAALNSERSEIRGAVSGAGVVYVDIWQGVVAADLPGRRPSRPSSRQRSAATW